MEQETELRGIVEEITFRREDSGFTVLDLSCAGELVAVRGVLPQITPGEELRLQGNWEFHPTYGRQFAVVRCERAMPTTAGEVLKYLSSGVIRGIGPVMAQRIVEKFGEDTVAVLEGQPKRLAALKGISLAKAEDICENFKKQFSLRQVMIGLERFGMTTAECLRVHKKLGGRAVDLVKSNPYLLCENDLGIGFERADTIAAAMPDPPAQPLRIQAGICHVLRHNLHNGHTCIPRERLRQPCAQLLEATEEIVDEAIETLVAQRRLTAYQAGDREFLFLSYMYRAERNIAAHLRRMLRFPPAATRLGADLDAVILRMEDELSIHYEEQQRAAIRTAMDRGLLILTGGPGTGKTTTLKGILALFQKADLKVSLAAPTGRAAKRMSDLTGAPAKTIHRLLEVTWEEDDRPAFSRGARNPLEASAVIIDELSMVDVPLFSALLDALPLGCRLVLVGDADQLPPVGAGCVLQDLLRAGQLPTVQLQKVFRQAMGSLIVTNAHAIVEGRTPDLAARDRDFFFLERSAPARAAETVAELCAARLPKAYGYHPTADIQILCPSRKGEAGTARLNERLQAALNPAAPGKREVTIGRRLFREGDKIMQIKNNYDLLWSRKNGGEEDSGTGIFNGDIGMLEKILPADGILRVRFDDDRLAELPFDAAEQLEHAYAVTVHKSQGSEFPVVVMPVVSVMDNLAYRSLLYTAVTRARKLMILVGSREQIRRMAENARRVQRWSGLAAFLREEEEALDADG
ncbi:MAG: ATP-dependent RecD-like DNA helicase [Oscillospiraceae bacterium]|jgi:exodeoxyribonuclease V alpha subunit|nr:ATP-dependent RecD-like DNA helicase [Oscillospiraceae bacterium]